MSIMPRAPCRASWGSGSILHNKAGQREGVLNNEATSQVRITGECALHVSEVVSRGNCKALYR